MAALQNMAFSLSLPNGMVKTQFLKGIPKTVADSIRVSLEEDDDCSKLAKKAERLLATEAQAEVVAIPRGDREEVLRLRSEIERVSGELAAIKRKEETKQRPLKCFSCGKLGHMARDCRSGVKCYSCGEYGHTQRFCSKNGQGPAKRPARY
jgi:hypothetical protein